MAGSATAASAQIEVVTHRYLCDRGVVINVTYVNGDPEAIVVLFAEGRQITLYLERSASGARYGWPSDGSNYVWWSKGDGATLLWRDGSDQTETVLVGNCVAQP